MFEYLFSLLWNPYPYDDKIWDDGD